MFVLDGGRKQYFHRLSQQLFLFIAEDAEAALVDHYDVAVAVADD